MPKRTDAAGPGGGSAADNLTDSTHTLPQAGAAVQIPPAPIRRLPFGRPDRVPIPLLPDADLEALRYLARGRLRRAIEREARLREGSDRSGPRVEWRLSEARA